MFRSILVPLDGSSEAEAALPLAKSVAAACGGAIHLLRVSGAAGSETSSATTYIDALVHEIDRSDVRGYGAVRSGEPATEIVKYSHLQHTDLIIMTTRGVGSRSILALTSVARRVVSEAQAPVLLLHPASATPRQLRTLLVPVDGSPGGSLALAVARALAHATHARIAVLEVVTPVPAEAVAAIPGMTVGGYVDPEWESLAISTAQDYVNRLANSLNEAGLPSESRIRTGDVVEEILCCAKEVGTDLVVMGTHAACWPASAFVGSVADRVLRESKYPVLLVRREASPGDVRNTHWNGVRNVCSR